MKVRRDISSVYKAFYLKEEANGWLYSNINRFLHDSNGEEVKHKWGYWFDKTNKCCHVNAIMYEIQKRVPDHTILDSYYIEEIEVN